MYISVWVPITTTIHNILLDIYDQHYSPIFMTRYSTALDTLASVAVDVLRREPFFLTCHSRWSREALDVLQTLREGGDDARRWHRLGVCIREMASVDFLLFDGEWYGTQRCYERALEVDSRYDAGWLELGNMGGGFVHGEWYGKTRCLERARGGCCGSFTPAVSLTVHQPRVVDKARIAAPSPRCR